MTLRDQIAEAMLPLFGDGVSGTREFQAGRMADAALAAVEAHVTQKQAEALRDAADAIQPTITTGRYPEESAVLHERENLAEALRDRADELDPRPEEAATGARWCGCAWCCAGNAPGLQPGSAHDICTTNRRPEEDHG